MCSVARLLLVVRLAELNHRSPPAPTFAMAWPCGHPWFFSEQGIGGSGDSPLTQLLSYIRPGVCVHTLVSQLIPPTLLAREGLKSWGIVLYPLPLHLLRKTKRDDKAVFLDTATLLLDFVEVLIKNRWPGEKLLAMTGQHFLGELSSAVNQLGLDVLRTSWFSLCHRETSHNLLSSARTILNIKSRGHLQSDASLRRCTEAAKILAQSLCTPNSGVLAKDR